MNRNALDSLYETLFWLSPPGVREDAAEAGDSWGPARRRLPLPCAPVMGCTLRDWDVEFAAAAIRGLDRLPLKVAQAVVEFVTCRSSRNPSLSRRAGTAGAHRW